MNHPAPRAQGIASILLKFIKVWVRRGPCEEYHIEDYLQHYDFVLADNLVL